MATTLDPAALSPSAGKYPLPSGHFDEVFATAAPRSPCAAAMDALAQQDLMALRERVQTRSDLLAGSSRGAPARTG
jgi:hypothetical protein